MLDYFLSKGYVAMDGEGGIVKLKDCPPNIYFESNRDGRVVFYAVFENGQRMGLSDIEDVELLHIAES